MPSTPGEKLVAVDKNRSGKGNKTPPAPQDETKETGRHAAETVEVVDVQDRLSQARASRSLAENARQKIIHEIMEASKALYQKLVDEGSQSLEKAKQLEADAELRYREAQKEQEHAATTRSEADAYRDKVIAQTQRQAQEMLRQAQGIKAEAVEFREKLLEQVRQQAQEELDHAQSERLDADSYREKIISEAQRQAKDILDQARTTAEQEGAEIVQRSSVEAEKILAQAELVRAAAQEQLEAQKLYAEVADLEMESKEVLAAAWAKLDQKPSQVESGPSPEDRTYEEASEASPALAEGDEAIADGHALEAIDGTETEGDLLPGTEEPQTPEDESGPDDLIEQYLSKGELPDNELVLGLEIGALSKAYPLRIVTEAKVINDSFNNQEVVVTFGPPSELGMIFDRTVEGRSLTFESLSETANGLMLMKDLETGTKWEALTGRAISGQLANAELQRLAYEYSFWFAWKDLHPQTEVYAPEQGVQASGVAE